MNMLYAFSTQMYIKEMRVHLLTQRGIYKHVPYRYENNAIYYNIHQMATMLHVEYQLRLHG